VFGIDNLELTEQQVKWLHEAADLCRGDYSNARYIQEWVHDILIGKDMTEEFKQMGSYYE
jgi:hypothetical protein